MSQSTRISADDSRDLFRLMGDIRALADPLEQGRLLVDGLATLTDADAGWFVEVVRQGDAWVPASAGAGSASYAWLLQYIQQWGREYPVESDIMATSIVADARPIYVRRWKEARAAAAPGKLAPFMDLVNTIGVRDMANPVFCLNDDHRFSLNLQRIGLKRRPFTEREINLLNLAATELRWLHTTGRLQLSALTRPAAPPPLPPRLKENLDAMLKGHGIKQIAYSRGISVHTVREHVQRLYRHFNVSGREELMAKFIPPGPPAA